MLPVVQWLNRQNIALTWCLLSGHYAGGTPLQNVTASVWQQEVLAGYAAAKKAAGEKAVPLFFVGYSLGGLLGQSVLVLPAHSPPFDRQILIVSGHHASPTGFSAPGPFLFASLCKLAQLFAPILSRQHRPSASFVPGVVRRRKKNAAG
jgi:alpha-beta hydrolase superfamily lysophospholipase